MGEAAFGIEMSIAISGRQGLSGSQRFFTQVENQVKGLTELERERDTGREKRRSRRESKSKGWRKGAMLLILWEMSIS